MRCAIVSDIHGNLVALQAVLAHAERQGGFEVVWCLGDVVGYGPRPNECVDLLRKHPHVCIAGNHDWAALGKLDLSVFNTDAALSARWTQKALRSDVRHYLLGLPIRQVEGDFTLVHGSPRQPIWEYLMAGSQAQANLAQLETPYCLVGHTHVPMVFRCLPDEERCSVEVPLERTALDAERARLIVNPGSTGQPRDGDPRASYMLLDTEERALWHHRVEYDVSAVQGEIYAAGLPEFLAERLSYGW